MGFSLSIRAQTCSIVWMKKFIVNLTDDERAGLAELVKREHVSALKRTRGLILLRTDEGFTDQEIVDELGVGITTVERVRQRCCERGVVASLDRKRQENPSRPRKLHGEAEAQLVRLACSEAPDGRSRWTLSLLADKLVELEVFDSVSKSTIQRGLKKTNSNLGE